MLVLRAVDVTVGGSPPPHDAFDTSLAIKISYMRRSKFDFMRSFEPTALRRFITAGDFVFALFCTNSSTKSGPGQTTVQKSEFANMAKIPPTNTQKTEKDEGPV